MVPISSVKEMAKSISWYGQDTFHKLASRPENEYPKLKGADGVEYGNYARAWYLMYARIYGAGHMVNENKAKQAKEMFYTWLFENEKFGTEAGRSMNPGY